MIGLAISRVVSGLRPLVNASRYTAINDRKHLLKYMAETAAKAQRRMYLQSQILMRAKNVVHATRRLPTETVYGLRKQGKCPAVIRREGFEDIDLVLEGRIMRSFLKNRRKGSAPLWVRFDGQQIKCIIQDIKLHPEEFIQKVELRRFIEGQPNEITIQLLYSHMENNWYLNEMAVPKICRDQIHLITYNEDYPNVMEIDVSYVSPMRPYRLGTLLVDSGDLQNLLPPGVEVNLKYHKLSERLLSIGEPIETTDQDINAARLEAATFGDFSNAKGELGEEEEEEEQEAIKTKEDGKAKPNKKKIAKQPPA